MNIIEIALQSDPEKIGRYNNGVIIKEYLPNKDYLYLKGLIYIYNTKYNELDGLIKELTQIMNKARIQLSK